EDGPYAEEGRIDKHRLRPVDRQFVRDYFKTVDHTEAIMREIREVPWSSHRRRLVSQVCPGWLRYDQRVDGGGHKAAAWGWLPGSDADPSPEERAERHGNATGYFDPLFADFRISPPADRATRELLGTCRDLGVPVAFVRLPESTEFAGRVPPAATRAGDEYL